MGASYLSYSAYFLSSYSSGFSYTTNMILATLYLFLGASNAKELMYLLKIIRNHVINDNQDDELIMRPSLILKFKMLRLFLIFSTLFHFFKFVQFGILGFFDDDITRLTLFTIV